MTKFDFPFHDKKGRIISLSRNQEILQGSRIETPTSPAETTTTTTVDAATPKADRLIGMTTNGGRRLGGGCRR